MPDPTITASPPRAARIGFGSAGLRMTAEEFDAIVDYDDLYRYELVDGVLVVTPIPSEAERDPNEELGHLLRSYRADHPLGAALDSTLFEHYIRTPRSRWRADRVIWAGFGRRPDPKADVPAIAVEFVSAGKRDWLRDYIEKRREYGAAGVREYWVIDRFERTMTIYHNRPEGYTEQVVREGETYGTDLLPGFELPLKRLLAAADAWEKR